MPRWEPNPFDVLGILPTIRLTPADVQRAYATALSWVRQCANPPYIDEQGKQYFMPYSEAELVAARDFFLNPANFDATDPTRFYPDVINSLLTNISGQTVLHYYSSWNPSACHPNQVALPIPGWPVHSICAFHRWSPPPASQKSLSSKITYGHERSTQKGPSNKSSAASLYGQRHGL